MTAAAPKVVATERYTGERKKTNLSALYFCIGFIAILFMFMGYCFFKSDITRIINGYDDCGNICGIKNDWNTLEHCGTNDKTYAKIEMTIVKKPTYEVDSNGNFVSTKSSFSKSCVERCEDPGFVRVANRCMPTIYRKEILAIESLADHFTEAWHITLLGFALALIFSYGTLILFRYAIKYIVWALIVATIALLFVVSNVCLSIATDEVINASTTEGDYSQQVFQFGAILFAILGLVMIYLAYYFRQNIALVAQIFKEAAKALNDIPMIVAQPILTFVAIFIAFFVFLYFLVIIDSAAEFKSETNAYGEFVSADYYLNAGMITAHIVNFLAFFWFFEFIVGCQQFVIASTISDWYFARSKDKIDAPITRGFRNLWAFHLGSICLGSIVFTAMFIVRLILAGLRSTFGSRSKAVLRLFSCCFESIFEVFEQLLQYLVRNAFIIVAKDGTPLFTSGKRAFHLLKENLVDVIALNRIGDTVLGLAKILVVALTGFVTYEMLDNKTASFAVIPVVLVVIFAALIISCFMTVFEMTIDTIFICFCEDCEENNGVDRPFFMSRDLMSVMDKLKKSDDVKSTGTGEGPLITPPNGTEV